MHIGFIFVRNLKMDMSNFDENICKMCPRAIRRITKRGTIYWYCEAFYQSVQKAYVNCIMHKKKQQSCGDGIRDNEVDASTIP